MSRASDAAEREQVEFNQRQREAQEARFRKVVLDNPDMTPADLMERFGLTEKQVRDWIRRLRLPKPPMNDGLSKLIRPDYATRRKAGRLSPGGGA